MRNRLVVFATVLVLAAPCPRCATGDDQETCLSTKLSLVNNRPAVAVDGVSGKVCVVWAQANPDDDDFGRVYGVVGTPQGGAYRFTSPILISPEDGHNDRPDVTYDIGNQRFLVVWDTLEYEADRLVAVSELDGRWLGFDGKL